MHIEFFTLVDITKTNIRRNTKSYDSSLTQEKWDFLRNQQRNWDVTIQLLGLRCQPENIIGPTKLINQKPSNYTFGSYFSTYKAFSVWKVACDFNNLISLNTLEFDFNNIPIIINLTESVKFNKSFFITSGNYTNFIISIL
jgi:hypothetical protein